MNHLPAHFTTRGSTERPPTRRAQAKQVTRDKVLKAAKSLFITRGYDAATIRDIAAEAGMSTGAVFASFTDKTELFHAVLNADLEGHLDLVRDLVEHPGPVEAAIAELFSRGYRMHLEQFPLLQAAISLSWTVGLEGESGERPTVTEVMAIIDRLLEQAQARKELKTDADLRLIADMLWEAYMANYRRAFFDHWGHEQLNERFARQIAVILAGARP